MSNSPSKIEAFFHNDGTVAFKINEGGRMVTKNTDADTFLNAFRTSETNLESPILPFGCRKYYTNGSREVVVLEYLQHIVPLVKFRSGSHSYDFTDVIAPRTFMFVLISKNGSKRSILKTHLYTADALTRFSDDMDLYGWPFSNHSYTYSSGVCWGTSDKDSMLKAGLAGLVGALPMYFNAESNHDLTPEYRDGALYDSWSNCVSHVSKSREEDYRLLQAFNLSRRENGGIIPSKHLPKKGQFAALISNFMR